MLLTDLLSKQAGKPKLVLDGLGWSSWSARVQNHSKTSRGASLGNIGSLEICASTYISAKLKKRTYTLLK